jgi:hypothetical protein
MQRTHMSYLRQGWATGGQRVFFTGLCYILKLHHIILKFILYILTYRYNNCYLVLNIIKCLNVICMAIHVLYVSIAFNYSCLYRTI